MVNSLTDLDSMRNLGASLADKGFFEMNFTTGQIAWTNEFALAKLGYTAEQAKGLTVFGIVPAEFHEPVTNVISDTLAGKNHKYGIWPFLSSSGEIVWWYTVRERDDAPAFWYKGECLGKTSRGGPDYAAMCVAMATVNGVNDLSVRFSDHVDWTKKEIEGLKETDKKVWGAIEDVKRIGRGAQAAAEKAANAAIENNKKVDDLKSSFEGAFDNQTAEIMRLISTDAAHDARFKAFETSVEKAAQQAVEKAMETISKQTVMAGNAITIKAEQAGKGLSRKVSVPVGIIATIATIIQLVLQLLLKK